MTQTHNTGTALKGPQSGSRLHPAGGRQEGSGKPETPPEKSLPIVLSGQIMLYYLHRKHEALLSNASK